MTVVDAPSLASRGLYRYRAEAYARRMRRLWSEIRSIVFVNESEEVRVKDEKSDYQESSLSRRGFLHTAALGSVVAVAGPVAATAGAAARR